MDPFDELLLKVYRAARELPVGEFQDATLGLLRERLRFNSAVWAQGQNLPKGVAVHSAHLYNEPLEMILDWQRINDRDLVVERVTRNAGQAQNINVRALYPGREHRVMRRFSDRYGHQNFLIIGLLLDYVRVGRCWLSLYRPDASDQYGHAEVRLLDALAPHLFEALWINRTIGFREHGQEADLDLSDTAAIARTDGVGLLRAGFPGAGPAPLAMLAGAQAPGCLPGQPARRGKARDHERPSRGCRQGSR